MKEMFTKRLDKLLEVKSIVTIILASEFTYLAHIGKIDAVQFMTVFASIIAFYYGTKNNTKE